MNELALTLAGSALRVTVVAAAAGVLVLLAARRRPGLAAGLAGLGLGMIVGLSVLAFCPLPAWWTWDAVSPHAAHTGRADLPVQVPAVPTDNQTPTSPPRPVSPGDRPWLGLPMHLLPQFWRHLNPAAPAASGVGGSWVGFLPMLLAVGVGIGLARLFLGLAWVSACRRRGRPVHDPALLALLEELRDAMGCRRPVAVVEVSDLGTAATVGWRRPLVLLPSDWRTWTEAERRAVLAHELAHVCRSDYLSGLLARLGVALHFYHPLVLWLAGRLRLQQELAADALGARFAGGRGPYLAALASLALRQDGRPLRGPARAFLPARGTLLRRVTMLRSKEVISAGGLSGALRLAAGMLLVAIGLGVSAVRLPAEEGDAPKGETRSRQSAAAKEAPSEALKPFDLSYVPPDACGLWAFRPAAAFGGAGMKQAATLLDLYLHAEPMVGKGWTALGLKIEEVDELLGAMVAAPPVKDRKATMAFRPFKVRTVHPFDWKGKIEKLGPGLQMVSSGGHTYYKARMPMSFFGGGPFCFFTPDDRTLVTDTEENLRRMLDRGPEAGPGCLWAAQWGQVEQGLMALSFDHRHPDVLRSLETSAEADDLVAKQVDELVKGSTRSVWGVDFRDQFKLRIIVECETPSAAGAWEQLVTKAIDQSRAAVLQDATRDGPAQGVKARWRAFAKDFYDHLRVERDGKQVQIHSEVRMNFPALLNGIIAESLGDALKVQVGR